MKLKYLMLTLFSFLSFSAFSATLNLNIGDVITLQPGTMTTVTCGTNGEMDCQLPIKNFETKLQLCRDDLDSVEDCLLKYWPQFKRNNNTCIEKAFQNCVSFCKTSPVSLECLDLCK